MEYKIIWIGSEDTVELWIDGMVTKIAYVKNLGKAGTLTFSMPEGEKNVVIYLPADATMLVVDGFGLVPHLSEYFLDNLHPNALGMELYGRNLAEEIRKSGF